MNPLIRQKYKEILSLVKLLPEKQQGSGWTELRGGFRKPLASGETLESRLQDADRRLSFLRMITPKDKASSTSASTMRGGTWVYKDGQRLENKSGTLRDANGRVVSNWDGKNLDPCSVKRHQQQLRRAGFVNNAHAKGFF
eukprot:Nitzschia sp. Nitz4//scaffold166_size90379//65337//65756//NITZ4_005066-RA/size90379-processed-gene-0.63-mRNA-1//-1//CDS//3329538223//9323//frame0